MTPNFCIYQYPYSTLDYEAGFSQPLFATHDLNKCTSAIPEVCSFKPLPEDEFIVNTKGEKRRMIFDGMQLEEQELDGLATFKSWLDERDLTLPENWSM